MVARKGFAPLISTILPRLLERRADWVCLLIGDGPERPRVEEAVAQSHLGSRVKLLGRVSHQELVAAYAAADVFVMPNVEITNDGEGFGLVTLEARVSGLPVVAFGLQGIVDALESDGNGSLVSPGDLQGFADAIGRWLEAPRDADERMARRERVISSYGWTRIARQYLDAIAGAKARAHGSIDASSASAHR